MIATRFLKLSFKQVPIKILQIEIYTVHFMFLVIKHLASSSVLNSLKYSIILISI